MGNALAATLSCYPRLLVFRCTAIHWLLQAGVPLGVTFSFLISAPMVNEVALVLLFGLFGWQVAALRTC